jgi:hypothetical protein
LTIQVKPRPSFNGRIRAIPEEKTLAPPEGGAGALRLECVVAPAGQPEKAVTAPVDLQPDGSFTAWPSAPPTGRYDVVLKGGYPSPKMPLVSDVIRDVDLAAAGQVIALEFALHPGAAISGRVVAADGVTPLPYVPVVARPASGDGLLLVPHGARKDEQQGPPDAHTDDEGDFFIGGLLPGEYRVTVEWDRDCFGYAEPVAVQLAEGEQRTDLEFRAARDWP